ncbi:MAG: hypothetical protein JNM99_10805 [Verrucomicrobiaceae bacterium]|nr:hypothetical protein [Verrucomicrobiaceae bacterium]
MRVRSIIRFIARGAIALPLFAFGHSTEFLDAKFYFDAAGIAHVEITADYAGNPMLSSKEEAESALRSALALMCGDQMRALTDFAPLIVAPRDKPDPDSPMPSGPEDPNTKHQLLTAAWQWRPDVTTLTFIVPRESSQTLVFWMKEPGVKEPRWKMLLPGESTPPIKVPGGAKQAAAVPPAPSSAVRWPWLGLLLVLPAGLWMWRRSSNHSRGTTE